MKGQSISSSISSHANEIFLPVFLRMRTKAIKSSKTDEEQNDNPLRMLCDFGVEQPKKAARGWFALGWGRRDPAG
jgi:hypothetical protein